MKKIILTLTALSFSAILFAQTDGRGTQTGQAEGQPNAAQPPPRPIATQSAVPVAKPAPAPAPKPTPGKNQPVYNTPATSPDPMHGSPKPAPTGDDNGQHKDKGKHKGEVKHDHVKNDHDKNDKDSTKMKKPKTD